jgi:hypothetical protein
MDKNEAKDVTCSFHILIFEFFIFQKEAAFIKEETSF